MRFSPAELSDLDALEEIEETVFVPADGRISRRMFRYHLRANNLLLVARTGGKPSRVAGYILVSVYKVSARILSVAVLPEFRGQGVSKRLIRDVLDQLSESTIERLTLEVRVSNSTAQRLYEQFGFETKKTLPAYYADGEAALRMELRLD